MSKLLRFSMVGALFLLMAVGTMSAQEPVFSAGPLTGAQNLQGLGFSWGDFNNDGYPDLFVEPNNVIVNNKGTSFTRLADGGVVQNIAMVGSYFFDYNNDGYPDLLVTNGGAPPLLYLYDKAAGKFVQATGVGDLATVSWGGRSSVLWAAAVGDYNGDGYVDIAWAGGVADGASGRIRLLKGGPTGFESVGGAPRTASVIDTTYMFEAWNPAFVDVNNDGHPDLFIPTIRNQIFTATAAGSALFLNNGNGTFSPPAVAGADSGLVVDGKAVKISMIASAWGDYNNDGIYDLASSALGGEERGMVFHLLKGKGDGTFTDVTTSGITSTTSCRGLSWGDYNNDGYVDLLMSTGWSPPKMWRNNGDGTFTDVTATLQIPSSGFATRSLAFVDYNSDGFLDFYAVQSPGGNVMTNGGNLNNWIGFKAKAAGNNGSGLSTRFTVYSKGMKQVRDVEGGGSGGCTGGNQLPHFGLGLVTSVDSVVVTWPNGQKQTFVGLAANKYWTIVQGSAIPATPTLATPADAATGQTSPVTLTWNAATNATGYRVQVSLDQTFTDPTKLALDEATTSTSKVVSVGLGSTYYWRVAGTNGGFISAYSAVRSFSTTATAATQVPTLRAPKSDSTDAPGVIALKWSKTSDAAQYRYQVSSVFSFSSFAANDLTTDTTKTLTLVQGRKYYWRVRGENGLGQSAFSGIDSFTVRTAPSVPALVSPANGTLNMIADSVSLVWRVSARVDAYVVELSWATASGLSISEYTVTAPDTTYKLRNLSRNTTYFWRVRAYNTGGTSLYSGSNSFTTVPAVPAVPAAASPASSATGVGRLGRFAWNSSVNATKYRLQIATDNAFATVVRDTVVLDTTVTLSSPLSSSSDYYWRVRAENLGGASAYSTARLFTTGTVLDVEKIAGVTPKEFTLFQNYPNPFNPSTTIRYDIPRTAQVTISIYDVLGRVVAKLVDEIQPASKYSIQWNPSTLSSGTYFCRIDARSVDGSSNFTSVKKLLYMK